MIVSNWKMNGTKSDIENWVNEVSNKIDYKSHIKCIICPPSCYLDSTRQVINKIDSPLAVFLCLPILPRLVWKTEPKAIN